MRLENRVVLVVGGASGIGRASVEACAASGAKVMIADVNEDGAQNVVSGIRSSGGSAGFVRTDIADEQSVKDAVQTTVAEFGSLNSLITSAGGGGGARNPDEAWHLTVDLFLKGPFYACRWGVPEMERGGGGAIVNISSLAGITGMERDAVVDTGYSCAKHGVIGLTRTLALAYAKKNIRVNAICPGWIRTPSTRYLHETDDGGRSLINDTLRVPMGRWGEPEEIGRVAAFLLSDDASFITGQPIIVDGGFMAR